MTGIARKLTTILAADVVRFSKMMGSDETGTLDTLKVCRAIIDGCIAEYRGRVFGSAGDSVVTEFSSPVQAVLCANEFQKLLAERNEHYATKGKMQFRVGVNMGDVIIDGDNLYGEGVNVAARLESIAHPGGICLSGKVYEEGRRKLDLSFVAGGAEAPAAGPAAATKTRDADASPTVAVSLLKVISGDEEIQSLVEGLREDILGGLAKMTSISVLGGVSVSAPGGEAAADFRLEGSVRAAGRRDAARDCVAGLSREQPDLTLRNMRPIHFADPGMAERYAQGLRDAGLPEGE